MSSYLLVKHLLLKLTLNQMPQLDQTKNSDWTFHFNCFPQYGQTLTPNDPCKGKNFRQLGQRQKINKITIAVKKTAMPIHEQTWIYFCTDNLNKNNTIAIIRNT